MKSRSKLQIKVCGMRDGDNIKAVEHLGVDMIGFIFYEKSPRYVSVLPSYLPNCSRVGVFVNADISFIIGKVSEYGLGYVQLHGDERADYCESLKKRLPSGVKIIKCIQISRKEDLTTSFEYEPWVNCFLFENRCKGYGGSGKKFDWDYLSYYKGNIPFILSGGIGSDDIDNILKIKHELFVGIDLNSRFELSHGIKDIILLRNFIKKLHYEQNQ